jgi:hypothetical protein
MVCTWIEAALPVDSFLMPNVWQASDTVRYKEETIQFKQFKKANWPRFVR